MWEDNLKRWVGKAGFAFGLVMCAFFCFTSCTKKLPEKRVLIFSKTEAYRHESIPDGRAALLQLCADKGIKADTTENAAYFHTDSLKKYSAVIFLSTSGNVLDYRQQAHFERYIQAGGGFVGIHSATDTEYNWPWFGELVGAYFMNHPKQQDATLQVKDRKHPSTQHLEDEWKRFDEWYNFRDFSKNINELIFIDESSYKGGKNGDYHPLAWYQEYDGGRAFYTALGHTSESYKEEAFLKHVAGGIDYAIGKNTLNYKKAHTQLPPEESNFVKDVLVSNLNEPMELEVFRGGKVLFTERGGNLNLFDPEKGLRTIAKINVNNTFEDGLFGIAKDPNYYKNKWIYLYYAPAGDEWIMNLSRFVYAGDSLFMDSEKVILQVPVQRETCCHTAGSIEFGPDGLLYLSTGDDTSPFNNPNLTHNSEGYGPMNEMSGWSSYDAQRSSGNTNDLRGKVLRIKPNDDGTYSIPDGNLFPKDGSQGKPEIYVMGCRNPYRISVDQKKNILYFGDIGPDANETTARGTRGYDEVNQAKKAGNYGWPLFVGNNQPYAKFNYATGEIGPMFDPERPINSSPNNTGMRELPPAQPAMVWYPYAISNEFEDLGTGGRNAMAGPVYYSDMYGNSRYKLSSYYDGKFFFYDWMRDWVMAATFDENDHLLYYEPFLPSFKFSNIMDIAISEDGVMYMLEYGMNWFSKNQDATLSRILYSEKNKIPVAKMEVDKVYGSAPLTVKFSAESSYDFDKDDELFYSWSLEGEEFAADMNAQHTFSDPGPYEVTLKVTDRTGDFSETKIVVYAGNSVPQVDIEIPGNNRFYWDGRVVDYAVKVNDEEDGAYPGSGIKADEIAFTIDYVESHDRVEAEMGHRQKETQLDGAQLVEDYNCFTCHKVDEVSNGPSFMEVARRYKESSAVLSTLSHKIINGGSGNWGEREMAANPSVSQEEAETMVKYILSLTGAKSGLPLQGKMALDRHTSGSRGSYVFKASYKDKGANGIASLSDTREITLISNRVEAEAYDECQGCRIVSPDGLDFTLVHRFGPSSFMRYDNIDFTDVTALKLNYFLVGEVTVRIKATGTGNEKILVERKLPETGERRLAQVDIPIDKLGNEFNSLVIEVENHERGGRNFAIDWVEFGIDK